MSPEDVRSLCQSQPASNLKLTPGQRAEIQFRTFELMSGRMHPFYPGPFGEKLLDVHERSECWEEWREFHRRIIDAMLTATDEVLSKP